MLDVRWPPFIVRDANRQALAYVYCEEEPGRRAAAKLLTRERGPAHRRQYRQAAVLSKEGSALNCWSCLIINILERTVTVSGLSVVAHVDSADDVNI